MDARRCAFRDLLEKAMEKRNINATTLSARTGFHKSYFSKLKSGAIQDVTWDRALAIIAALDMTPDEFMTLGGER